MARRTHLPWGQDARKDSRDLYSECALLHCNVGMDQLEGDRGTQDKYCAAIHIVGNGHHAKRGLSFGRSGRTRTYSSHGSHLS